MLLSNVLRKKRPIRKSMTYRLDESFQHKDINIEYDVELKHLIKLNLSEIKHAYINAKRKGKNVLDQLYYEKELF